MVWVQSLLAFALWIGWGVWQARRVPAWRERLLAMSRTARGVGGPILLFCGAGVMLGGLFLVQQMNGLQGGALTPLAWGIVILIGLAFVQSQIVAGAMMISLMERGAEENERQS